MAETLSGAIRYRHVPKLSFAPARGYRFAAAVLGAALALMGGAWFPSSARASRSQIAIIEDPGDLTAPAQTLAQFRELGADTVRVSIPWATIAPNPRSTKKPAFDAAHPNAYPASGWAPYDAIVQTAKQDGLTVDLTVSGGAPLWAEGSGDPAAGGSLYFAWKPSASDYGQFVRAVGSRYDGHFTPPGDSSPLPAVHFWTIFNEPNFGEDLGPQAIDGSRVSVAPMMYRRLVSAAWNALQATGHGRNTILIGEFAARGISAKPSRRAPQGYPGTYGQTKPLIFIRTLYCVNTKYQELRGSAAKSVGCPTNAAGARKFRRQNPGLFKASGVGDHPVPDNLSPIADGTSDPNFATIADLGRLERTLDKVNDVYGSTKKYDIYNDEYGYITSPPSRQHYVSPATAAYYINWAEYLSWKNPRVKSYMQYLLKDPQPTTSGGPYAGYASGLEYDNGQPKRAYNAYRLPLYLPKTSFSRHANIEVWGDARPAPFMQRDRNGPQTVSIQLNDKTIRTVRATGSRGYFDVRMRFAKSGTVRLAYTYPSSDPFLPVGVAGSTVHSRSVKITMK
jgi:hypothetical protein